MKNKFLQKQLSPTMRQLLVKRSIKSLSLPVFNNVLVVGSGTDPYRNYFKKKNKYICLDITIVPNVTDICGDALTMPFSDSNFDCILASELLEHLKDPFQFVNELHRIATPGGTVILTVPWMCHQHAHPFDYWRFTDHALKQLFLNFSETKLYPQGNRLHVIWDLFTTSFYPVFIFFPFRIFNHLLIYLFNFLDGIFGNSTAPSGYLVFAKK